MAQTSAYNRVFARHGSSLGLHATPHNLHQIHLHIDSSSSDNKKKRCTSIREEEEEEEEEAEEEEEEGEESCCSEDAMAMDQHQQQRDRKQAIEGFASHGIMRTGLMRYHSAPSSILASLLGLEDDFLQQEAEFARLFPEDIADFESKMAFHFDMDSNGRGREPGGSGSRDFESKMDSHFDIDKGRPCSNGRSKQGPALPPITAAAAPPPPPESSHCIRFTSPHSRLQRAPLVNQSYTSNPMHLKVDDENPGLNPDPMPSCHGGERLSRMAMDAQEDKPSLNSSLIPGSHGEHLPQKVVNVQGENFDPNHSSNSNPHFNAMPGSYGEPLSQMNIEVKGENLNLCFSAPVHPPDCCLVDSATAPRAAPYTFPMKTTSVSGNLLSENGDTVVLNENRGGISPSSKNGLLRHSSSHAGLLLRLNDEKLMLQSSSGNSSEEGSFERRVGPPIHGSYAQWDERVAAVPLNGAIFAARKRIREVEDKFITNPSIQQRDAMEHDALLANQFSLYSCENPYITDKMSADPVPCRTRAKRGCATHPRSIAERVRRTKISERMKRLQELVPNMEKQANMTAMLDEAVEYVKHLQQRVRELTEEQSKCHCTCKEQESISSH